MGLKPQFRLVANSQDITDTIRQRFISLRLTDEAGLQSDTLEVKLADHDPRQRIILPPTGAELELWLGYDGQAQRMGLFVVDGFDLTGPPDAVTIKAKASPYDGTPAGKTGMQTQKTRSWDEGTLLGGMVQTIAEDHNLEPAVADSLASITLPHIDQINESDISLITRVAKNYDAIAKPAGGKLILAKRGQSRAVSGQPLPAITLTPGQVTSWRVSIAKRNEAGTVIATWRDVSAAADHDETVGTGEPIKRLRHQFTSQAEARKAARAEYQMGKRAGSQLAVSLPGDPDLISEGRITLEGFRDGVNGEWLLTRVEHMLDASGYKCSLAGEVPED